MKNIKSWNLLLLAVILSLISACASIVRQDAKIIGRARLSDNPPEGHAGVLVSTSSISTITAEDGSFELVGAITGEGTIYVYFEKQGYKTKTVEAKIPYPPGENEDYSICDLGTIVLERIPSKVFDDFNDGNADGWIEDDKATYRVESGEYSIESPDDGFQHWAIHSFVPGSDFYFEAQVKYISGNWYSPYGIGIFDTSNTRTCLFICKDGWYKVCYYDNSWHNIRDWTESSVVDTVSGNWNKLKIVKEGTSLEIYINDSKMGSFSSSSIGEVEAVGLYVQDDLHIHFDNVRAEPIVKSFRLKGGNQNDNRQRQG